MVDIFYEKMCKYCKNINNECKKEINIKNNEGITIYKCEAYIKK